jgi:hypothetical protein
MLNNIEQFPLRLKSILMSFSKRFISLIQDNKRNINSVGNKEVKARQQPLFPVITGLPVVAETPVVVETFSNVRKRRVKLLREPAVAYEFGSSLRI